MPALVAELRKSLYVDDLISGKPTVQEAKELKEGAISVFVDAKFKLHKWHSNFAELEERERAGLEMRVSLPNSSLVTREQRTEVSLGSYGTNKKIRSG